MRWTKLYIKNFLSIEEAELDLDKRGLVLVEGKNKTNEAYQSNGSGKSSLICDSIAYVLYDTTTKDLKADDVVNNVAGKNTSVILEGYYGEDKIRIERYRKHSKYKNKVRLLLNDKDISEKSTRDTNKAIEKLVGIDYNTFINSIMFSQGSGAGRFATATDKEKKEILENLVNLDIYSKAQEIAKDRVKLKQDEIRDKEQDIERLNWELANVDRMEQQDQENYEHTLNLIRQEQSNLEQTQQALTAYTDQNAGRISELNTEISELKKKQNEHTNIDISSNMDSTNKLYNIITEKQSSQKQLIAKKEEIVAQYKKIQTETHCPVCGNELDQEHREKEMLVLKEKLRPILIQLKTVEQELTELTNKYNKVYAEYQRKKQLHEQANQSYREIVQQIQNKERQIQEIERTIQGYKDQIQNIKSTLEKLNKVPKPRSRDDERESIREKIKAERQALLALEKEKTKLEDVVKVFSNSGVKSHVLDLITPFLNERANEYLSILTGSDIEIVFTTQKQNKDGTFTDKFDVQVINATGGESYQANSEGEKKRIDLAISLAIQDLVMTRTQLTTNFVVYDEVFDALDGVGSENVIQLLKKRLDIVDSIFVITHNDILKNLFENVITVVKVGKGLSRVEEGIK